MEKRTDRRNLPQLVRRGNTASPPLTPHRKLVVGQPFSPMRSGRVLPAPEWIVADPGLSFGAKVLWQILAWYCGREMSCFPSLDSLGKQMGISGRQVKRYAAELRRTGRVEISVRKRYTNLWTLVYFGPTEHSAAAPMTPLRHHSVVQPRAARGLFDRTSTAPQRGR